MAANNTPVAFGLTRVSSDKQFKSHLSIENQQAECQRYFDSYLSSKGTLWGGLFGDDEGISSKIPTLRRPAAIELDRRLHKGDHVICLAVDRLWRDMADLVAVTNRWMQMGVTLHFVQERIVFDGSANALFQLQLFTALAQCDRSKISQRQKDANAARRALIVPHNFRRKKLLPGLRSENFPGGCQVVESLQADP